VPSMQVAPAAWWPWRPRIPCKKRARKARRAHRSKDLRIVYATKIAVASKSPFDNVFVLSPVRPQEAVTLSFWFIFIFYTIMCCVCGSANHNGHLPHFKNISKWILRPRVWREVFSSFLYF
jgi:hypothetical protein